MEIQHLFFGVLGINRCAPEGMAVLHPYSAGLRFKQLRIRCILTLRALTLASSSLCFLAGPGKSLKMN